MSFTMTLVLFYELLYIYRNRTISSTSFMTGSRLVVADTNTPADNLHASAFLHSKPTASTQVSVENLSRPLYRKDIFYSGSVLNVSHIRSRVSLKSYVVSIASIPSIQVCVYLYIVM